MMKVYTEVLDFNNLMYRTMWIDASISLADLAYYTLASYLSEEYLDFVMEYNGLPFVCDHCEDEQFENLPKASQIQPQFQAGDTFKMVYDLEDPFEIEITIEEVNEDKMNPYIENGRGFAIWDGFKEFQDVYFQSLDTFKEFVEANEMELSDFPIDEDLDILKFNEVFEDHYLDLKEVYEEESE